MDNKRLSVAGAGAMAAACLVLGIIFYYSTGVSTAQTKADPQEGSRFTYLELPAAAGSPSSLTGGTTLINEVVVNPNGTDSNCEYIELAGLPSAPLTGLYFVSVEGDSGTTTGQADFVVNLTAGALGTNGLLVLTGLDPSGTCDGRDYGAPSGTLVFRFAEFSGAGLLENGTNAWILVHSPTTAVAPGTDLDTNNDGTLDGLPGGAVVVDGFGWSDGGAGDIVYGAALAPTAGGTPDMATRFPGNVTPNSADAWYWGDMGPNDASPANSLEYDPNQVSANFPTGGALTPGLPNVGTAVAVNTRFDFDGDAKTDPSVFRPVPSSAIETGGPEGSSSQWWIYKSSDGGNLAYGFGTPTDLQVAADFTGDGKTDVAFWRASTAEWFILRSEDLTFFAFPFGANGDIPAPGDFDGDGKADPAVFRPSNGTWFIFRSSDSQVATVPFGVDGDRPTVADFDGDGTDDIAVFRPSVSQWWQLRSSQGVKAYGFGEIGDRTSVADWTGDGKADISFYRPSTSEFYVIRSEDESFYAFPWGTPGDIPVPGDYDGDGTADAAIWRPSNTTWFILGTTSGFQAIPFGATGDIPVPSSVSVPAGTFQILGR